MESKLSQIIALVPAKSNSRRVPGKNMAEIGRYPMFAHSVFTAQQCRLVDEVVVSSDSNPILKFAQDIGAVAQKRPIHLCSNDASNFDVCCFVIDQYRTSGIEPDALVLLQPTHPFRTSGPLEEAIQSFLEDPDADSLVTVANERKVIGEIENNRFMSATKIEKKLAQNRPLVAILGHLIILRPRKTLDRGVLLGENIIPYPLPDQWLDVDVDTPNDMLIAHAVAESFFTSRGVYAR
jgi:CMP-N-acetylneuraminic acid synthetase